MLSKYILTISRQMQINKFSNVLAVLKNLLIAITQKKYFHVEAHLLQLFFFLIYLFIIDVLHSLSVWTF